MNPDTTTRHSQRERILARLKQGGKVPMPELSRIGSGSENGWVASFSKRISDIRDLGYTVNCHREKVEGRVRTFYELIQ